MKMNRDCSRKRSLYLEELHQVEIEELWGIDERLRRLRTRKRNIIKRIITFECSSSSRDLTDFHGDAVSLRNLCRSVSSLLVFVAGYTGQRETLRHLAQLDALASSLGDDLAVIAFLPDSSLSSIPDAERYEKITLLSERDGSFCYNLGLMELHRNGDGIVADYIPALLLFNVSTNDSLALVNFEFVPDDDPMALLDALVAVLGKG